MQSRFTNRFLAGAGVAACAAALLLAQPASAQTDAISSFTSVNSYQLSGFTVGYTFSVAQTITVSQLGYFDFNSANSLVESHQVAIYNPGGSQIVLGNVTAGGQLGTTFTTAGGVVSGFRYAAVAPTVLGPGTYTIGAFTGGVSGTNADQFFYNASSINTATGITYIAGVAATSSGLAATAPTTGGTGGSYFGPDFRFTVGSAVAGPEPGTMALLGMGLVGMGGIRLRRRSRKNAVK